MYNMEPMIGFIMSNGVMEKPKHNFPQVQGFTSSKMLPGIRYMPVRLVTFARDFKVGRMYCNLGIAREATALAHRVVMATVDLSAQLNLAECWLVWTLYVADSANMVHILQNVQLTGQFQAPADGLNITNNNRPAYFNGNYAYDGGENI